MSAGRPSPTIGGMVERDQWLRREADVMAHRPRLLRMAVARTTTREDAEDVVAEAIARCLAFDELDNERLGPFLTSVTVRLCIDRHRHVVMASRVHQQLVHEDVDLGPEDAVCDQAEAAWVAGLVASLPERQRQVLTAKADGMSCDEIASRFQLSYKAVESSLARARAAIRRAMTAALAWAGLTNRYRRPAAAPGIALSVVASATVAVLSAAPSGGPPARSPALGATPDTTRRAVLSLAGRRTAPVPGPAPRPAVDEPYAPGPVPEARRTPEPIISAGPVTVDDDGRTRDYTTAERIGHCLVYGVDLEQRQCRYPTEGD
jgi:RNA polymerase sigma factor (sigma-70 family)